MPRLSADAKRALAIHTPTPLEPSPGLCAAERASWRRLLAACPAGFLTERDRPLVRAWVALDVMSKKLAEGIAGASWEELADQKTTAGKAAKALNETSAKLAVLANRLKIAPLGTHSAPDQAPIRRAPGQGQSQTLLGPLVRAKLN